MPNPGDIPAYVTAAVIVATGAALIVRGIRRAQ